MESPELTIIIPVFNGENTVRRAVESIISLNPSGIEIILIDDSSTDGSLNLCKILANEYNSVKVLSNNQNVGVAQSRQNGLNESSGQFVTFCDQDDIVCSSYEPFIRNMHEDDADILVANYFISYKGNSHLSGEIENESIVSGNDNCKYLAKGVLYKGYKALEKPVLANTIWNCIFRRSVIMNNNLQIKSYLTYEDDWLFLIDFLSVANKVKLSAEAYYTWIVTENSQSKQTNYIKRHIVRSSRLILKVNRQARLIIANKKERICFVLNFIVRSVICIIKNMLLLLHTFKRH